MGWATNYMEKLRRGETIRFRPRGGSMKGRIESGQLVTVSPVDPAAVRVGDIVLCSVRGTHFLHLVKAIRGEQYLIGNNRGGINGWISGRAVFGLCTQVEP